MKVCSSLLTPVMLALTVNSSGSAITNKVHADFVRVSTFNESSTGWSATTAPAESYSRSVLSYAGLQRGTISGQVVLPSGQQVNTRFRITVNGYRVSSLVAYTDNRGRFVIPNISDGTYTLEVDGDRDLFEPVTQEVRVTYGSHPGLVITLREKRNLAPKPVSRISL